MTIGEAWERIDAIAAEQGKSQPKTAADVYALGNEAIELFTAIDAAHSSLSLRALKTAEIERA